MHRMGRLSCWRKIEDFKTRERKRNKRLAELDGLVPLVEPKRNRVVAAIADVFDRIHEFSLKNLGITWRKLSRGAYLIGMWVIMFSLLRHRNHQISMLANIRIGISGSRHVISPRRNPSAADTRLKCASPLVCLAQVYRSTWRCGKTFSKSPDHRG